MASFLDTLVQQASGGAGPNTGSALQALASNAVGTIVIRSQVSPDVVVNPFAPTPPPDPSPNPLMMFIRPEVQILAPNGQALVTYAPYGQPQGSYLPVLIGAAVVFVVGLFGVVAFIARRVGR